jgi:AcrR family transcriptional regulator
MARRLTAEERRAAILEAAAPLFAERGFHGIRTAELARAAGVSEALLYKHFPSKEELYAALRERVHAASADGPELRRFLAMPASTEKLVLGYRLLLGHLVLHARQKELTLMRLTTHSLLEDGDFARTHLRKFKKEWFFVFRECLDAARRAGDLEGDLPSGDLAIWLAHHLGFAIRSMSLPRRGAVDYGMPKARLVDETVRFLLRGIGLRPAAIRRYHRI